MYQQIFSVCQMSPRTKGILQGRLLINISINASFI